MKLGDFGVPPTFLGCIFRILGLLRFWGDFAGSSEIWGEFGVFWGPPLIFGAHPQDSGAAQILG